jgi:hypothetical protein
MGVTRSRETRAELAQTHHRSGFSTVHFIIVMLSIIYTLHVQSAFFTDT